MEKMANLSYLSTINYKNVEVKDRKLHKFNREDMNDQVSKQC